MFIAWPMWISSVEITKSFFFGERPVANHVEPIQDGERGVEQHVLHSVVVNEVAAVDGVHPGDGFSPVVAVRTPVEEKGVEKSVPSVTQDRHPFRFSGAVKERRSRLDLRDALDGIAPGVADLGAKAEAHVAPELIGIVLGRQALERFCGKARIEQPPQALL